MMGKPFSERSEEELKKIKSLMCVLSILMGVLMFGVVGYFIYRMSSGNAESSALIVIPLCMGAIFIPSLMSKVGQINKELAQRSTDSPS